MSQRPGPRRLLVALAILACGGVLSRPAPAAESGVGTERWYETLQDGQKLGHVRVVWAPSTWEGKTTVHDTTVSVQKSVRNMMGTRDVFEVVTTSDLERGTDGTLWWMRVVVEEAGGRKTIEELTWNGKAYDDVTRLEGQERHLVLETGTPVSTDAESFLGERIREGRLHAADRLDMRVLDYAARGAATHTLEVIGREDVEDASRPATEAGAPQKIHAWKVRETDPQSGGRTLFWIDDDGAIVRLEGEGGVSWRRVDQDSAQAVPVHPYEHTITTPSEPVLERVMSADELDVDLHLRGDETRPVPDLPESPWSRVVSKEGDDQKGWILHLRLTRYDDPDAKAPFPLDPPPGSARDLESTVLINSNTEKVQKLARKIVGDAKDARTAATRLARWVQENLEKRSPNVAQASALEILDAMAGDCSEHALLFVAFCRAVGIPARLCSGYVNVASMWGAHSWAEIWIGAWVGADPTTGEVGTGARYVFFGYDDAPDSFPGLVSARLQDRMRFVATRIVEGGDDYDLEDPATWHREDPATGRYVHVLAGIEARDAPRDWVVRMTGSNRCLVRAPGVKIEMQATADQGYTLDGFGGEEATFAGAPARRVDLPGREGVPRGVAYLVHSRRRIIQIVIHAKDPDEVVAEMERVFAPTFAARPLPPPPAPAASKPGGSGPEPGAPDEGGDGAKGGD